MWRGVPTAIFVSGVAATAVEARQTQTDALGGNRHIVVAASETGHAAVWTENLI
jgi:hypothetical protein